MWCLRLVVEHVVIRSSNVARLSYSNNGVLRPVPLADLQMDFRQFRSLETLILLNTLLFGMHDLNNLVASRPNVRFLLPDHGIEIDSRHRARYGDSTRSMT